MQARLLACIIIRALFSVVEFQRQLYVSRWLCAGNLSHRGSQTHVGCVVLDVVEGVDEVGPELQTEPLSELKILMQTHVNVCEMGRAERSKLRCAIAESSGGRIGEISVVCEPLNPDSGDGSVLNRRNGIAVGSRSARERAGIICGSSNR